MNPARPPQSESTTYAIALKTRSMSVMGFFANHASLCVELFGDDAVRPLDKRYENCGTAELCSPILQVCFRNPTGTGAGPSRKNRNMLPDNLLLHFAQRGPADREDLQNGCFPHEVSSFAGEENLHLVTCVGQRKAMRENERRPSRVIRSPRTLHHDLQWFTRCGFLRIHGPKSEQTEAKQLWDFGKKLASNHRLLPKIFRAVSADESIPRRWLM